MLENNSPYRSSSLELEEATTEKSGTALRLKTLEMSARFTLLPLLVTATAKGWASSPAFSSMKKPRLAPFGLIPAISRMLEFVKRLVVALETDVVTVLSKEPEVFSTGFCCVVTVADIFNTPSPPRTFEDTPDGSTYVKFPIFIPVMATDPEIY